MHSRPVPGAWYPGLPGPINQRCRGGWKPGRLRSPFFPFLWSIIRVMTQEGVFQDAVCRAVCLGWRLAALYDCKKLPGPPGQPGSERLPPHLPGLGEMSAYEKACALAAHVDADIAAWEMALGVTIPGADSVRAALAVVGHQRDDVRGAVFDLYVQIRDWLAGSDVAAATGFGLGRMLADAALLPTSEEPQILGERFEKHRLANAYAWLDDLDARLPAQSAAAVRASLRAWEHWVSGARRPDDTIDPAKVDDVAIRALHRQGEMWRRLLTGEQAAEQLLDARAYVGAAASLLANARRIALHYLWKWSWAVLSALTLFAAAIWAAVTYAPAGTTRLTAVLFSAAGFLGVSWAGVRATLGRALRQAESALWKAEVLSAIGRAATIFPKIADDRPESPEEDEPRANDEPQEPAAGHAPTPTMTAGA